MSRGRRIARATGIVAAAVLLLLLGLALALRLYGRARLASESARFEAEVGSLDPGDYTLPPVPDDENAARYYAAAAQGLALTKEEREAFSAVTILEPGEPIPEALLPTIRGAIERNSPVDALLERAASLEKSTYGVRYADGADAHLPNLLELVYLGRFLAVRGRIGMQLGDEDHLFRALRDLGGLAEGMQREPSLISVLVGIAVERFHWSLVREAVLDSHRAPSSPERLLAASPRVDPRGSIRRAIGLEAAIAVDSIRAGRFPRFATGDRGQRIVWPIHWFTDFIASQFLGVYMHQWRVLGSPYPEARRVGLDQRPPFLGPVPNLVATSGRASGTAALRVLARAAVRATIHRRETGDWPPDPVAVEGASDIVGFVGTRPEAEVRSDGTLVLTVPGGDEAWKQFSPVPPMLTWALRP